MLRLLRKIGKQQVSEGNSRTFWLFTISEFVLVILGILIALQIDNWNQERQERKIIDAYLVLISKDLQTDIQRIEELMETRQQALIHADSILSFYRNGYVTNTTLFYSGFSSLFIETRFHPNMSAFESLKNSGFMKDLENLELEEQLNQYYLLLENISFVEDKFINMTQTVENSLILKGFFSEWNQILDGQNGSNAIATLQLKYPEYEAAFLNGRTYLRELINDYKDLLLKGNETLDMINKGAYTE